MGLRVITTVVATLLITSCQRSDEQVQISILQERIETLPDPVTLDGVFNHLSIAESNLEIIWGDTGMGASNFVYSLTPDYIWRLHVTSHRISKEVPTNIVSFVSITQSTPDTSSPPLEWPFERFGPAYKRYFPLRNGKLQRTRDQSDAGILDFSFGDSFPGSNRDNSSGSSFGFDEQPEQDEALKP